MMIHRGVAYFVPTALLLTITFSGTSPAEEPKSKETVVKSDANAKRPRPKITISKETTYITEPLRADGYPDYLAAINQRCSAGVTPENNAAIPFWQAVGPKGIDQKVRKRYFELLGIAELPEEANYLVPFSEFLPLYKGWKLPVGDTPEDLKWAEEAERQFDRAQKGPWSKEEYPVVVALLEKNEKPLQILVDSVQRPRYYSPVVAPDDRSMAHMELGVGVTEGRAVVRQLAARAMLRIHNGETAAAWQDTLAGYRLARLYGQRPLLVDRLVAMAVEGNANAVAVALSQQESITAAQAREFQLQLRALLPMLPMKEVWNFGERAFCLDYVLDIAVNKEHSVAFKYNEWLSSIYNEEQKKEQKALKSLAGEKDMDWDEALRLESTWLSRWGEAAEQPTLSKRLERAAKLDEEGANAAQKVTEIVLSRRWWTIDKTLPAVKAQRLVDILHGPGPFGITWKPMLVGEARCRMHSDLALLAFALAGYRHDHHNYPKTLNELVPKYIDAVPKDRFTDGDLHYKSEKGGYLLYSVGPNGKDDGGRNFMEDNENWFGNESATEEEKSRDDIAIRTPPKQIEKK